MQYARENVRDIIVVYNVDHYIFIFNDSIHIEFIPFPVSFKYFEHLLFYFLHPKQLLQLNLIDTFYLIFIVIIILFFLALQTTFTIYPLGKNLVSEIQTKHMFSSNTRCCNKDNQHIEHVLRGKKHGSHLLFS